MSESDSSDLENYGSIEYWKSRPPEEVLEAFIYEIKGPLASIKGWVEILHKDEMKEVHPQALETIPKLIEYIEKVEKEILDEYLPKFKEQS
jgi:hypothetical protein